MPKIKVLSVAPLLGRSDQAHPPQRIGQPAVYVDVPRGRESARAARDSQGNGRTKEAARSAGRAHGGLLRATIRFGKSFVQQAERGSPIQACEKQ